MVASSNGSNNTTWRCEPCNVKNGAKYKYCWQCWGARPTAAAAGSSSAAAGETLGDKSHDEKLTKVQHYRAKLVELRKLAEDPFLEESLQPQVAQLEDKLAAEQEQRDALDEKLADEQSKLGKFDSKLETLDKKIQELSVPAPGKGWAAALAFMEQAEQCVDDDESEKREQLVAAVTHAKEQKALEEERAKQHEARAAKERASSADNRKRSCPESPIKEDLLEIPAGASEQDICKSLVDVGVTPDQAGKVVAPLKLLVGELQTGHALAISKTQWARLAAYTVNANTVKSLERVVKQIRDNDQDVIVLGQELQASGTQLDLFQTRMRKEGWNIGVVSSAKTKAGHSAGVLIATSRSRGMDFVRNGINQWDISPRESTGRLAVAWVDAYSKEGLVLGTAYLWNSEGRTQRNQRILVKWGATMNAIQKEWILGGDFNMDPVTLEQSEIVHKVNGIIVRDTLQGSCLKQDGTRSTRDYFIVSRGLVAHALKPEVQEGYNTSPHLPAKMRVPVHQRSDYIISVLCKRAPGPLTRPTGCPSQPVRWPRPLAHKKYTQGQVDEHWSELGEAYEKHLKRYHSFDGDDLGKRQGHFEKVNYKQRPRRPMPCTAAQEQQQWAEAAEWLARRLRQLRSLANAWQQRRDAGTLRRAQHIADGLLSHDIVTPLLAERAPGQTTEAGNDTDEEDGLLEPEGAPREEAEGVQGRFAVRAPPTEGQQDPNTWNTIRWPLIVHTLRDWRVTDIDDRAQNYPGFIATLLDIASRKYWKMVHRAAAAQWRQWVTTHGERGAGALHKWTKAPAPWQPQAAPAGADSEQMHELTHPQKAADAALKGWESIWHDPLVPRAPWLQPPTEIEWAESKPPPITPQQVIEACGRFRTKTGLGESGWHPTLWREGGIHGAARVASTLNALEAGSPWPQAQDTILFYLLAKASGGYRNLGLIPELARLWETIRMPYARRWEHCHRRSYDWAARGRPSERAAREQALFCEATVAQGMGYAVTYFDLVKCFEYVTHEKVWQAGTRSGFNTVILKMVLRIYSMTRRIALDNMVIFGELDGVIANFPRASVCLFFDDLAVATRGARLFVQHWHTQLVQELVDMFGRLDMKVSKGAEGKTVTMASTTALQDGLARRVNPLGIRMARHADHLGVTTAAGRRRRVSAFSKRASKYAARRDRIARIRRAGGPAQAIIRQGKVPSAMYGVQVMGLPNSTLTTLRQSVATSFRGNTMGRSTPLTLLAQGADPATRANTEPLLNWAMAWHEVANQDGLQEELQSAWKKWVIRVGTSRAPWQQVRGPAGAFIVTVQRLGWRTLAAHSITIGDEHLDLRTLPLRHLGQLISTATEDGLKSDWLRIHGEKHGLDSLFVEPVAALLRMPPSKKWTLEHQTRVRSLWCGGTWPQRRLFDKGARPATSMKELPSSSTCEMEGSFDGLVHGGIYTDGSLLYGAYPALRRGGWAVVKLDSENTMEFALFGPLEGSQHDQSIYKSELMAVLQALRRAVPPVRVFSDCQSVIDGFARGPEWAARADTTHQEVWQECWRLVQENGGTGEQGISFCKVRAHATRAQKASIGPQHFIGNGFADAYAKRGAQMHQHEAWHRAAYIQRFQLVSDILEFAAPVGVLGHGLEDTSEGPGAPWTSRPGPPWGSES
ncbi:unnamed protein product [Prorocentrum cordatum]|uniref:Uncharacterized protein n=1 Tax=Prorocentrum cordatum TaxID=2364126 RepID=A0ABN9U515_9DINO|nr:unnamed protein product [Polarella glacialis]